MKRCIVNVALGSGYVKRQKQLEKTAYRHGCAEDLVLFSDVYPPGSPPHGDVPYAFKAYALEEVMRRGYELLLWCDASMQFVRSPDDVFEAIEKQGHYSILAGFNVGQWCTDSALENLEITRDEAFEIPLLVGGFFGVDLRSDVGIAFMDWFGKHARNGSFVGAWTNERKQVSQDPRVLGHRHDQTILSVFVWKYGLQPDTHPGFFAYRVKGQSVNPKVIAVY